MAKNDIRLAIVAEIAKQKLGLPTLALRNRDSLDFSDQHVTCLKHALLAAYDAGAGLAPGFAAIAWQLADDASTYGADSGKWIITTIDGEIELNSTPMSHAKAQMWADRYNGTRLQTAEKDALLARCRDMLGVIGKDVPQRHDIPGLLNDIVAKIGPRVETGTEV